MAVEGIQGEGYASVWDNKLSNDFWRYAGVKRQDAANAAKLLDDEKKRRDKTIDDNLKFSPDKTWEPFYGEVADIVNRELRGGTVDLLNRGASSDQIQRYQWDKQAKANTYAAKSREYQNQFNNLHDLRTQGEKSGYYKPGYYSTPINDIVYSGRQAKYLDDIDFTGSENIFNDSRGYNMSAIASDFMKSLPQQMTEKYRKQFSDLGEGFDITRIKSKIPVILDKDGQPMVDPRTGQMMYRMTDDLVGAALENPYIRNYVIDNLGEDVLKPNSNLEPVKNLLAPILTPYDQRAVEKEHKQGFKYSEGDRIGGGGYTLPEPVIADRYDTLYRITHGYEKDLVSSILPAMENVSIKYDILGPGESKKSPGRLVVSYPNKEYEKGKDESETNPRYIEKKLDLSSEDGRQEAMEYLNSLLDKKLPAKQKIGENFTTYRKKKRKELSDAGGLYEQPSSQSTDGAAGWYSVPKN